MNRNVFLINIYIAQKKGLPLIQREEERKGEEGYNLKSYGEYYILKIGKKMLPAIKDKPRTIGR